MSGLSFLKGKEVGIFGAGAASLSLAAALLERGVRVYLWDPRKRIRTELEKASISCVSPESWPWQRLALFVPDVDSPVGFFLSHPLLKTCSDNNIPVRSIWALYAECLSRHPEASTLKTVGITGTHGKSTTLSLVREMVSYAGRDVITNQEVTPGMWSFERLLPGTIILLELSARQLAFAPDLKCQIGVILNLTSASLSFFNTPNALVSACARLFRNQEQGDSIVIGTDDPVCQKMCTAIASGVAVQANAGSYLVPISGEATLGQGIFAVDGHVYDARGSRSCNIAEFHGMPLNSGPHMNQTVAAAFAVCLQLGISETMMAKGAAGWTGLSGRMSNAGEFEGVTIINDACATRLRPTISALAGTRRVFWVAGGKKSGQNFGRLKNSYRTLESAFFYGEAAEVLAETFKGKCGIQNFDQPSMALNAAFSAAREYVRDNKDARATVLVSPACSGVAPEVWADEISTLFKSVMEGSAA